MLGGAPSPVVGGPPAPPLPPVQPIAPVQGVEPVAPPVAPIPPMEGLPQLPQAEPGAPPPTPGLDAPQPGQPKKKAMTLPPDLAQRIARAYADKAVEMAATLASQSGPPDGAVPYATRKQIKMWRSRDPLVDVSALREQGVSESEISRQAYPLRSVLLALAGRSPLEKVRYAQHMKRISANYKDVSYSKDSNDDETSDDEIVYDSENESSS